MRKLASIQMVESVRKHPNADTLDLVQVKGWQVVSRMGEFKAGDKVVFFETDSFLPIRNEYEFLRKSCFRSTPYLGDGFRLRTIRLRGELSQGLVMSLASVRILDPNIAIDTDLTDILEVKKWEPPIPTNLEGNMKGGFPSFIKKTDQERIQNCYSEMSDLYVFRGEDLEWHMEEKMDGSSCTIYHYQGNVGICSHNVELNLDGENKTNNSFVMTAIREGYLDALSTLGFDIAVQAELCGPGIQKNRYALKEHTLFIFDIWLIKDQCYALQDVKNFIIERLASAGANVHVVPYLGKRTFRYFLTEALAEADGMSQVNPKSMREGIVFKSANLINGQVVSFKAVSNQFLVSEKE